eukprot:8382742-Pyramimonas_sp.AAC.3
MHYLCLDDAAQASLDVDASLPLPMRGQHNARPQHQIFLRYLSKLWHALQGQEVPGLECQPWHRERKVSGDVVTAMGTLE